MVLVILEEPAHLRIPQHVILPRERVLALT
jgi:hypothetical protein